MLGKGHFQLEIQEMISFKNGVKKEKTGTARTQAFRTTRWHSRRSTSVSTIGENFGDGDGDLGDGDQPISLPLLGKDHEGIR